MKRTKTKLVSSIVTLLICFAMLVGSTFAWFTDSASTGVNTIQAGNLDIELKYYDGGSWEDVNSNTKLFDDNALWEPGHTEVAYLHIKNAGSLDLKYKMNVNVPSEKGSINQKGDAFKLSDYLVFKVIDMTSGSRTFTGREAARDAAGIEKGLSSWTKAGNLYADPIPTTAPNGVNEEYVALVIYMPETVGNEANHKTGVAAPKIELGVNIVATQLNSESDSFGNDYDANADGNPDNGAAWTMAAFRAVADVPSTVTSSGMTIAKYENNVEVEEKLLARITIPAETAASVNLTETDKVEWSVVPAEVPDSVTVGTDEVAFNYDIKLMKVAIDNTETVIASVNNPVTVKLNVGKGLSGVKIYHSSTDGSGNTTTIVSGLSYDSSTGIVTFTATSFSDYTVVYSAKAGTAHYTLAEFNALTEIPDGVKVAYVNLNGASLEGGLTIGNANIADHYAYTDWNSDVAPAGYPKKVGTDKRASDGATRYIYSTGKSAADIILIGSVTGAKDTGGFNAGSITLKVPDAANVIFEKVNFGAGQMAMSMWTEPNVASMTVPHRVTSVTFDSCTFNGNWIQNGAFGADEMIVKNCTFNKYENTAGINSDGFDNKNNSNPIWIQNLGQCNVTIEGCTINAVRPIKLWEGTASGSVTIKNNTFNMSNFADATGTDAYKNVAVMFCGTTEQVKLDNVEITGNTVTGSATGFVSFYNNSTQYPSMAAGATFKLSGNTLNGAKESVIWKTDTEWKPSYVNQ